MTDFIDHVREGIAQEAKAAVEATLAAEGKKPVNVQVPAKVLETALTAALPSVLKGMGIQPSTLGQSRIQCLEKQLAEEMSKREAAEKEVKTLSEVNLRQETAMRTMICMNKDLSPEARDQLMAGIGLKGLSLSPVSRKESG